jgi:hypothetical protein
MGHHSFANWFKRKRYVWAMMRAIKKAQRNVWNEDHPSSRTNALRVIKQFENVNKREFDPFDSYHVDLVTGHGQDEAIFRGWRLQGFMKNET